MKPLCVVSCPIDTFSGYGARSRDFVKSLIKSKGEEWTIQVLPQRWGNCAWGYIEEHKERWGFLENHLLRSPQLPKQPEVWIQITVPNEFQPVGKYNIGVTAGMETTICDPSWVEGCNRMHVVLTSSEHSKKVFQESKYKKMDQRTGQAVGELELITPIDVLFEGVDLDIYKKTNELVSEDLDNTINNLVEEDFAFLFVGHWLQGDLGQDRKDVGMLCKVFLETFKNKKKRPALILKTSGATSSILDRDELLKKIDLIRKTCKGDLPNIYLLHGEMDDYLINDLYNHSKVKAMVSFTKGEGFGRPLLEFSLTQKPIIVSNWSGHVDFLNKEFTNLVDGKLNKLHPSAVVQNMLIADSEWFTIDYPKAGGLMRDMFENYKNYTDGGKRQAHYSKTNFAFEKMTESLDNILKNRVPEFPKPVQLKLPQIKKIELPKVKKVEPENIEAK